MKAAVSEHQEQASLFQWIDWQSRNTPELELCFAVPNGGYRPIRVAKKMKNEGQRPGVPDICFPCPRGIYHGLWIELKVKGGRVSENQQRWLNKLEDEGYLAKVCYGWNEARALIVQYLALKPESSLN